VRVGSGFDAHRFDAASAPIVLGGVVVDPHRGVAATSDGDVLAHAIADAVFGAVADGDLGSHFPEAESQNADSMALLAMAVDSAARLGFRPTSVDVTVIAESVRIAPHRDEIRSGLASVMGLDVAMVSVKATTTDGMGAIGADEGIAAMAIVVVEAA